MSSPRTIDVLCLGLNPLLNLVVTEQSHSLLLKIAAQGTMVVAALIKSAKKAQRLKELLDHAGSSVDEITGEISLNAPPPFLLFFAFRRKHVHATLHPRDTQIVPLRCALDVRVSMRVPRRNANYFKQRPYGGGRVNAHRGGQQVPTHLHR